MIKKKLFKFGSVFMCAALMACSLAACGTTTGNIQEATVVSQAADNKAESTIGSVINSALLSASSLTTSSSSTSDSKEETVFVFTDATGKQDHLIVNEKLKNVTGQKTITDSTNLSNVTNLTGDETFSTNGAFKTWAADGNSITYQGTSSEQAPITMKVTYYLDGKEISAANLAGKSGKVTMRYDYTNNAKKAITVNGKTKTAYVPFTMMTGMILPSDNFSNITVTNGKLVEANNTNVVVGITMPGLKDSLNMSLSNSSLDIDIPDYFEVTADVTDFELDMTLSVATCNLLNNVNLDNVSLDNVESQVDELQSAANQLVDGSTQLADGTSQLADKVPTLKDGTVQLADGTSQLFSKMPELTSGITQLDDGAGQIADGTSQLFAKMPALTDGISQLDTGADQLVAGVTKLNEGVSQLADEKTGLPALSQGVENYTDGVAQLSAANASQALDAGATQVAGGISSLVSKFGETTDSQTSVVDGAAAVAAGTTQVSDGVDALATALNTSFAQIAKNAAEYGANAETIKSAQQLDAVGSTNTGTYTVNQILGQMNASLVIAPSSDITAIDVTDSAAVTALYTKYMNAYAFIEANKDTNATIQAINAVLSQTAAKNLSNVYGNEMGLLLQTVSNKSIAGALQEVYQNSVNADVSGNLTKLAAGANAVETGAAALKAGIGTKEELSATVPASNPATICQALNALAIGSGQVSGGATQINGGLQQLSSNSAALVKGAASAAAGAKQLVDETAGVPALLNGTLVLKSGLSQLVENSPALADGVTKLNTGATSLKEGTTTLNSKSGELSDGVTKLNDGAQQLKDGVNTLSEGVGTLNEGAITLKNGMVQFNEEGISKITNLLGQDAEDAVATIKKVIELGKEYQSFAGKADGTDGNVKFIYKTDGIN